MIVKVFRYPVGFDTIPECDIHPATQPASQPASHVAVAITLNAKASSLKTGGDMLPSPYDPLAYLSHTRSLGPPQAITAPAINISALNKVRRFNCVITTMKIYRHKNSVQRFIGGAKPPKYGMP